MSKIRRDRSIVRQAVRPVIEGLESRQLLSATLDTHGTLGITAGAGNDSISVGSDSHHPGLLNVTVDGKVSTFTASKVKAINISAGAGNDTVNVASAVLIPATENGGAGNDLLLGGGGNDSLIGGDGNDTLNGRAGNDSVSGGNGNDTVIASAGKDKLDGGAGKDNVNINPADGVPLNTLSQDVQNGLITLAKGAPIGLVQSFLDGGQTYFGTIVTIGGVKTRIVVNSSGTPVSSAPPDTGGGPVTSTTAYGAVVGVDTVKNTITIATTSENAATTNTTFTVTPSTTITANDVKVGLAALIPTTWVSVKTSSTSPTTAVAIVAIGKEVAGTVTAVGANTITIGTTTYNVSPSAVITVNGAVSLLPAVTVNSHAVLHLAALDPTTALRITDTTTSATTTVQGKVVSVNTSVTPNTITIAGDTNKTFNVAANAPITLGGVATTLGAILANDTVVLKFAASDPTTAISVAATAPAATTITIAGTVASVDTSVTPNTITVGTTTYNVAPNAPIKLGDVVTTLSAILPGDHVVLKFSSTDLTTAISVVASVPTVTIVTVQGTVSGVDTSVTPNTITVTGDTPKTYNVAANATITLGGVASTLSAIVPGDKVVLKFNSTDSTTAISVAATVPATTTVTVQGTVSGVDTSVTPNTITVTGDTPKTYNVAPNAVIKLGDVVTTLSAILPGDHVVLTFNSTDLTTAISVSASVPVTTTVTVQGTVSSVSTSITPNTITLTGDVPKTYNVAANALITLGGAASTLSAIVAGDKVVLKFNSTDLTTAISVSATIPTTLVQGSIVGVNIAGNTITVKTPTGSAAGTPFTLNGAVDVTLNGVASTLDALAAGDSVGLTLAPDGTVLHIHAEIPKVPG